MALWFFSYATTIIIVIVYGVSISKPFGEKWQQESIGNKTDKPSIAI